MNFFLDTANIDQIKQAQSLGILNGVTTNPSLMLREGIKSTEKYLSKCNYLLEEDGHLLIESHHPGYEKISDFDKIINRFVKEYNYTIIKKSILKTGFFYDDGRKFFILRKNV